MPKPKTQITAFPFNRSVLIDFITYKSFRTKGKGGYLGYILFLQPLFVFFNRPCSFFPFPPCLAFNTVLFSHTACLALPLSICSQGFLPSFSLSLLKPEAVCFKSVTSSLSLIRSFYWNTEFHHSIHVSLPWEWYLVRSGSSAALPQQETPNSSCPFLWQCLPSLGGNPSLAFLKITRSWFPGFPIYSYS